MKPPTREELTTYCKYRGNDIDVDQFMVFYEDCIPPWTVAKGFKGGSPVRVPMTSWRSCVITWERNGKDTTNYSNVKKREQQYKKEKAVYTQSVKKKPTNPKILELNKEQYALAGSLRGSTAGQRIDINAKIRSIHKQIEAIKDKDSKLGNIIEGG